MVAESCDQEVECVAVAVDNAATMAVDTSKDDPTVEQIAVGWKEKGNSFYSSKEFRKALEAYQRGIDVLRDHVGMEHPKLQSSSNTSLHQIAITLRSNKAMVLLKVRNYVQADLECTEIVTSMDPNNIKVFMRRAKAREGLYFDNTSDMTVDRNDNKQLLISSMEDYKKTVALIDEQSHSTIATNSPVRGMKQDCQRSLDRLEKEYNRILKEEQQHKSGGKNSSRNGPLRLPQQAQPQQNQQKSSSPHTTDGDRQTEQQQLSQPPINQHHHQSQRRQRIPVMVSSMQQKKDVMRLLMARQSMMMANNSNSNRNSASTTQQGEAFFLIEWNWWYQWCRYVDFFYNSTVTGRDIQTKKKLKKQKKNESQSHQESSVVTDTATTTDKNNNTDRIQRVLKLLPPGAVFPEKPRKNYSEVHDDDDISSSSSDDDDDQEHHSVEPPGTIDNTNLIVGLSDKFYQQWYTTRRRTSATVSPGCIGDGGTSHGSNVVVLKPNLVRGYHYELVPREVYNALRSWYGESTPSICRRTTADHQVVLYPVTTDRTDQSDAVGKCPPPTTMTPGNVLPRCHACRAPGANSKCRRCMSVRYCDRSCQESHWAFHKGYCNQVVQRLKTGENLDDQDPPSDSNGRVGLNQLGNTCFMNSALQALSHSTPLSRFFLSGRFKSDINPSNPLGTGGKLALAFESVMRDLWMKPGIRSTSPTALKRAIAVYAPSFAGCLQHDSQEFLAFLLDGLHEDLNRVREKRYVEFPDVTNGDNMAIAAAEAWDARKSRNDSFILDSFAGQFQSTCICPQCNRVSVSFDAFTSVSLEIPQPGVAAPVAIPVLVYFADGSKRPVRYGITIGRQACMLDLKKSLSELSGIPVENLVLTDMYENSIYELLADNKPVSSIQTSQDTTVAYEVVPYSTQGSLHAIVNNYMLIGSSSDTDEGKATDERDSNDDDDRDNDRTRMGDSGRMERKAFGLPFMTSLHKDNTCRDLWVFIWKTVRRMVLSYHDGKIIPVAPDDPTNEFIDAARQYRPEDILTIRLVDGQGRPQCVLETDDGKATSVLHRQSTTLLSDFLGDDCTERFLFLHLEWRNPTGTETSLVDERRFLDFEDHSSFQEAARQQQERAQNGKKGVSLDQCFQSFSRPERLDEHNMWYCSKCKEHVRALKTMKLWRLPNILVVHLKRFEVRHGFRRDKLDTFVNFPLAGLNMEPYRGHWKSASEGDRPFVDDTVPAEYDLFAVVNHYGRMGFGHYTAFAMPWDETGISKEWCLYDDSSVRPVNPNEIQTSAAFLLFYRRRQFN